MTPLTIRAPAKLNLGLAVTGRRPDGFHDLVTIFQAVSIADTLAFTPVQRLGDAVPTSFTSSDPALLGPDNLILRAVDLVRQRSGRSDAVDIRLEKAIPAAAGLGGASSDAAATLLGLDRLWDLRFSQETLHDLALRLGSDVPFFLGGGCAIGQGRGEQLRGLAPCVDRWFVVVTPALSAPIPRKTASLFAALRAEDWGDGSGIIAQAARIESGLDLDPNLLGNAFERPLSALRPELDAVRQALRRSGAPFVALSGAGPSFYTAVSDRPTADGIESAFRSLFSEDAKVFVCAPHNGIRMAMARISR